MFEQESKIKKKNTLASHLVLASMGDKLKGLKVPHIDFFCTVTLLKFTTKMKYI